STMLYRSGCACRAPVCFENAGSSAGHPLSLHDALPICPLAAPPSVDNRGRRGVVRESGLRPQPSAAPAVDRARRGVGDEPGALRDRKSTRLDSSHVKLSYAGFCLKKKILDRSSAAVISL